MYLSEEGWEVLKGGGGIPAPLLNPGGNCSQHPHSLLRVRPCRRLPGKHECVRPLPHHIRNVRHLPHKKLPETLNNRNGVKGRRGEKGEEGGGFQADDCLTWKSVSATGVHYPSLQASFCFMPTTWIAGHSSLLKPVKMGRLASFSGCQQCS